MRSLIKLNFTKTMFICLLSVLAFSCKDDEEVVPSLTIDDLVGTWHALSATHTNNADPSESLELVKIGFEIRYTVLDHGGVRTWVSIDTFSDEWDAQIIIIDNNTIRTVPEDPTRTESEFSIVLDGDDMEMTNVNDSFDFTLMGESEVSTTSVSEFIRD